MVPWTFKSMSRTLDAMHHPRFFTVLHLSLLPAHNYAKIQEGNTLHPISLSILGQAHLNELRVCNFIFILSIIGQFKRKQNFFMSCVCLLNTKVLPSTTEEMIIPYTWKNIKAKGITISSGRKYLASNFQAEKKLFAENDWGSLLGSGYSWMAALAKNYIHHCC